MTRTAGAVLALIGLCSCDPIKPMPDDLPCREAGYAIAARTAECTGDAALGQARYEDYRARYSCILWEADDPALKDSSNPGPEDLFSCAFTLRNIACEVALDLGDDIDGWLSLDPGCTWVAQPKGAGR
jgi:hypothetical protein